MSFTTRIDILDLIIEVLAGHEKELDGLIERLEQAVRRQESTPHGYGLKPK